MLPGLALHGYMGRQGVLRPGRERRPPDVHVSAPWTATVFKQTLPSHLTGRPCSLVGKALGSIRDLL